DYWQMLPVHTPLKHWLPAEQDWPLFSRQAVPAALHVKLAPAQLVDVPGVQANAQLTAFAQAILLGQGLGEPELQLPAPLQVPLVNIDPEHDPHEVVDE